VRGAVTHVDQRLQVSVHGPRCHEHPRSHESVPQSDRAQPPRRLASLDPQQHQEGGEIRLVPQLRQQRRRPLRERRLGPVLQRGRRIDGNAPEPPGMVRARADWANSMALSQNASGVRELAMRRADSPAIP
jgi:hypothetical protein